MSILQIDAVDRRPPMSDAAPTFHPEPGRLLVVENDPDLMMLYGAFFRGAGIEVDICDEPLEVAARVRMLGEKDSWYGAEIHDWGLPGMTGGDLAAEVLVRRRVPIAIVSAEADGPSVVAFQKQYGCKVVGKPFNAGELIDWVREVMRSPAVVH